MCVCFFPSFLWRCGPVSFCIGSAVQRALADAVPLSLFFRALSLSLSHSLVTSHARAGMSVFSLSLSLYLSRAQLERLRERGGENV